MKLPGMGDVKNKNVAIGAGAVGVIVFYAYWKKRKGAAAPAAGAVDPNAIDPATGIPYGQEAGSGGGYYTNASVPNPYVTQTSTADSATGGQTYTNNATWLLDAEQYATNQFGVSYQLATTAFGKYLAQSAGGLNPDEYQAVSETVALIGPPPTGTHRLIQAPPVQNPSSTPHPTPEPDQHPTPTPTPTPTPVPTTSYGPYFDEVPTIVPTTSRRGNVVTSGAPPNRSPGELPGFYGFSAYYWDGYRWIYT